MTMQVPKTFIRDHMERELPSPVIISERAAHFEIAADDPNLAELLDDARYYAKDVDEAPQGLIRAARALVASIERQR